MSDPEGSAIDDRRPGSSTSAAGHRSEGLISVEEAQARALAPVTVLGAERVALPAALGRVLAEDVIAAGDVPPHANSAMDGYALRSADATAPTELEVIGEIAAGQVATRALAPGQAYRIMTGAPLPPGADAVVMQEQTSAAAGRVRIAVAVRAGEHVRARGEDLRAGARVLARGTSLGAVELGLIASARRAVVAVTRRPQVAVLATGDELRDLDEPLGPGAIADSNGYTLAGLVREAGGEARLLPIVRDDRAALASALAEARRADLIVSSGGVSVGAHDHVKEALEAAGATLTAWRVDMKPGKPVALAVLGATPFYGLPGNPVSTVVAFHLFVRPALRAALGCARPLDLERAEATLATPLATRGERRSYLRASLAFVDGKLVAQPMTRQGSGVLSSLTAANGLIVVEAGAHSLAAGAPVTALIIGPLGRGA